MPVAAVPPGRVEEVETEASVEIAATTLPRVWIDGDGAPRVVKEIVWKAAERGALTAIIVANRTLIVPKHRNIQTVTVKKGLDVADDWLVAHAGPGELVITADIPLAAELVPRGVEVMSPRGEWFTPSNIGEKLSFRDFFTEARASGMIEGSGPAAFDERAKRVFANGLDAWITRQRETTPTPR
ncbi:MAG: YaiI/YqxD family protein [Pseudomonadota bacterium]|nr:YaiI/YqxD family protein [Pseudomonadota bacterium]